MSDILVIGGGFAGLSAAVVAADEIAANGGEARVTLVSRDEYIVIRPRLYEKDPEALRVSLLPSLEPIGVALVTPGAAAIDTAARAVTLEDGRRLSYDRLILAAGSVLAPLPVPGADAHGWDLDTWQGAVDLDRQLARIAAEPAAPGHDTLVVIGGGMTGIEFAAEARGRVADHGGATAAEALRVVLIEQAGEIGPEFGVNPRPVIADALAAAGVEVRLGARVAGIDADGVTLADGERIDTATTVIATGMRASPLTEQIPGKRDGLGRLVVDDWQRVPGVAGVYATGDAACARVDEDGRVALMSCQHARTMGKYAGLNAARDLLGLEPRIYRQPNYTTTLDLGSYGAVYTTGWDRRVEQAGADVKARKRMINTEWIYPPRGTAEEIFAGLRIDANGR